MKQVSRTRRALVKVQALVRGRIVRKQAAASLRCMRGIIRVQALARGHRVRSSELGQLIHKHIQQTRQQRKKPAEGWVSSMATLQQLQAKAQSKQDAVMKRQRALVYAFSEQLNRSSTKQNSISSFEPDKSHWSWIWLERWMAAQSLGIPHTVGQQHNSNYDKLDRKLSVTANNEMPVMVEESVEPSHFSSPVCEAEMRNHLISDARRENRIPSEKEIMCTSSRPSAEQVREKEESFMSEISAVEILSAVKRPSSSPPPPPALPPSTKLVPTARSSALPSSTHPHAKMGQLQPLASTKNIQKTALSIPSSTTPSPPQSRKSKPLAPDNQNTIFESQQVSTSVDKDSQMSVANQFTSSASSSGTVMPDTYMGHFSPTRLDSPDLSAEVFTNPSISSSAISQTINSQESSISRDYTESSSTPNQVVHVLSPTSVDEDNVACQNEGSLIPSPDNSRFSFNTSSLSQIDSSTQVSAPEVLVLHPRRLHAASSDPLINQYVVDEDTLDLQDGARNGLSVQSRTSVESGSSRADDLGVSGEVFLEEGKCSSVDITDMVMHSPEELSASKRNGASQIDHSIMSNGRDRMIDLCTDEKTMEMLPNTHSTSPSYRQGEPRDTVSPSVPNYMSTTQSSKAKVRSPTQKLDSPNQKSAPSKPRFDASKQKADPSKQRFDSLKQKLDSPKQKHNSPKQKLDSPTGRPESAKLTGDSPTKKGEFAIKRRHSLSAAEDKGSPRKNKSTAHFRSNSKCHSLSLRGDTSADYSPHSNGHQLRLDIRS
ncbi:hypothetical protein KP509_05G093500 [Ceratopteris richardii]|nr:hypothetical protein KP509_05G093500 [Ceratopteris richardii]